MKKNYLIQALAAGFLWSHPLVAVAQNKSIAQKVDSVLKLMTLEEKVGQLNQYTGREVTGPVTKKQTSLLNDIRSGQVGSMLNVHGAKDTRDIQQVAMQSRLKIPLLFSLDIIHGYKTVFPIPLAEAASWDIAAIQQSARIAATEAAAAGIHWTFAPMVDIARDPRWGRVMEGAGEDAYLGARIAVARVNGFQGNGLGHTDAVMACAKHFAGYGAAIGGRDYNAVDMSLQQLWQTYLPPFKAAAEAGAATFMNAFNTLNGIPATGNAYLQREVLKKQWNYKGFVVSDWGSIGEMTVHGYTADDKDAALHAMLAGSDMDMESVAYKTHLVSLVKEGKVPVKLVDEAVRRILLKKFEMGLFDDPYRFSDAAREAEMLNNPAHKLAARQMAERSIVLLKNNNNILPLANNGKRIALIGPLAHSRRDLNGSWTVSPDTSDVVSFFEGMKNFAMLKDEINYAEGCRVNDSTTQGFAQALQAAAAADIVVMALGETWDMSGEGKSRTELNISATQEALFYAVKKLGKPVVLGVFAGRPLIFNELAAAADAIVYAWWPGSQGGNALANLLYGAYNPSAKLPISFPAALGQVPLSYNNYNTGRPVKNLKDIRYKSAYIDAPNIAKYAFGFGLSYTQFTFSDLKLSRGVMGLKDSVRVSLTVTNTGRRQGEEVVQLYLRDRVASVVRPVKELFAFEKISLQAGASQQVSFMINANALSFYNSDLQWVAEPGMFDIMAGNASDHLPLQATLQLQAVNHAQN